MSDPHSCPGHIVHGQAGSFLAFAELGARTRTPPGTAASKALPTLKRFHRRLNFSVDWKRRGSRPEGHRTRMLRQDAKNGLVEREPGVSGAETRPSVSRRPSLPPSPLSPTRQMSIVMTKRTARQLFGRKESGCMESPERPAGPVSLSRRSRSDTVESCTDGSPFDHLARRGATALPPSGHDTRSMRRRPSGDLQSQTGGKRSRSTALSVTSMTSSVSDTSPVSELLRSPETDADESPETDTNEHGNPDDLSRPGCLGATPVKGQHIGQPGQLSLPGARVLLPAIAPVEAAVPTTTHPGTLAIDSAAGVATPPIGQDERVARRRQSSPLVTSHAVSEPVGIPGKPRGRSMSLQERRQGNQNRRPSMSFSLPTNLVVVDEDTSDDTATDAQRDMLFSKATEMIHAAAHRNTIGGIPARHLVSDSPCAHPTPSPSSLLCESLHDWAAAELQQYMEAFAV